LVAPGAVITDRAQHVPAGPILRGHAERGGWMIYFAVAILVVDIALAVPQWLERRSDKRRAAASVIVTA
jgi:hypothetical protein